jgi:hypothetical protein
MKDNVDTVTCDHTPCGQVHMVDTSVKKTVWVGQTKEVTYHYCCERCMHDAYIAALTGRVYE